MNINDFLKTVTNTHIKNLIEKKLNEGCKLEVRANDSSRVGGRYICGHGGFTILSQD